MVGWSWVKKTVSVLLPRGQFARSVTILAGGTALGQAITVLASPILTRLYTPGDFGTLAVYSSILSILTVIASWRYELAIPLPERDEDAANLVVLCLGIVILMSLVVSLGAWLLKAQVVQWLSVPGLRPYVWLLPIGVFLVGSYQVFSYWATRKQAFAAIACTKLYQGLGTAFTQVVSGLINPLPLGLLLGQIVGQSAGVFTLFRMFWRPHKDLLKAVNSIELSKVLNRYRRFPLYSSWAGIFNTLSMQLPILMLSSLFGATVTGFYMLAYRVLWIPTQLISQSTTQVLLPTGAEARRQGNVSYLVISTFRYLVLIGLPYFVLIGLIAPEMAMFIFGENWREAGVIIQWLIPWVFLVFVASPLSAFSIILEKQCQEAIFQIVLLASRLGALLLGWKLGSSRIAIGLFAIASTICWLGYLVWIMKVTCVAFLKVGIPTLLKEFGINAPFFLLLICFKVLSQNMLQLLVAGGFTAFLVTALVVYRLHGGRGNSG
ncbi:oligosaccharide flippase family protein [Candidatus Caldatribacterium saccharofermentans]|uniref:oligosaccharide flippase family protein n=1 Tax=Candidatus Caldatribacterium saccharofermentans TaxID=1454753 RepID=UPI003D00A974